VTAPAESGQGLRATVTGWGTRVREIHPVRVLRWLRACATAMVIVTALLFLLVSAQATQEVGAARRTGRAIMDIDKAYATVMHADKALADAADTGEVDLIGTGSNFANDTARVNTLVTSATEGNAAGRRGLAEFQFVQGQLTTAVKLANGGQTSLTTARQALTAKRVEIPQGNPIPGTGGLTGSLLDLRKMQRDALGKQRESHWLNPAYVWTLLVGPPAVMLLCVLATGYVVASHFRRYVSPRLVAAALATAGVGITVSLLCRHDAQVLNADPLIGHWLTRTLALCLLAAAGVLAHLGYRPRLAEYRFPRS
jgi:hypothetical protein